MNNQNSITTQQQKGQGKSQENEFQISSAQDSQVNNVNQQAWSLFNARNYQNHNRNLGLDDVSSYKPIIKVGLQGDLSQQWLIQNKSENISSQNSFFQNSTFFNLNCQKEQNSQVNQNHPNIAPTNTNFVSFGVNQKKFPTAKTENAHNFLNDLQICQKQIYLLIEQKQQLELKNELDKKEIQIQYKEEFAIKTQEFEQRIQQLNFENQYQKNLIVSSNLEYEQQQKQIQNLINEKNELQQQLKCLNLQNKNDKSSFEALKSENQSLKEQIQYQIKKEQELSGEILGLNHQKKRLDELVQQTRLEGDSAKHHFSSKLTDRNLQLEKQSSEKMVLEQENLSLQSLNKGLQNQVKALEFNLREEKKNISETITQVKSEQNEKEQIFQIEMNQQLSYSNQKLSETNQKLQQLSEANKELEEKTNYLSEQNIVIELEKQVVNEKIKILKSAMEDQQKFYENEIQVANDKINWEHGQFLIAQDEANEAKQININCKKRNDRQRKRQCEAQNKLGENKAKIEELELENQALKDYTVQLIESLNSENAQNAQKHKGQQSSYYKKSG